MNRDRMLRQILDECRKNFKMGISKDMVRDLFPDVPAYDAALTRAAFAMSGNRMPETTSDDKFRAWCRSNSIEIVSEGDDSYTLRYARWFDGVNLDAVVLSMENQRPELKAHIEAHENYPHEMVVLVHVLAGEAYTTIPVNETFAKRFDEHDLVRQLMQLVDATLSAVMFKQVCFADLAIGDAFVVNGKRFVKTTPVYAPKRGYLVSNARNVDDGTAARFGGAAMVAAEVMA